VKVRNQRLTFTICRCSNPAIHEQAFCCPTRYPGLDGRIESWEELADSLLETAGKSRIGRREWLHLLPTVFAPVTVYWIREHGWELDYAAAHGEEIRLNMSGGAEWQGSGESRDGGRVTESGIAQPTVWMGSRRH
jgi:hypothetical protein